MIDEITTSGPYIKAYQMRPDSVYAEEVIIDPDRLIVDAELFQFKQGGDEAGYLGQEWFNVWDPDQAGIAIVWEQADGRVYIADGHQRLANWRRLKAEQPDATPNEWKAKVFKETDGYTPKAVRNIASWKNMKEGTGTTLDAALLLNESADKAADFAKMRASTNRANLEKLDDSMRLSNLHPASINELRTIFFANQAKAAVERHDMDDTLRKVRAVAETTGVVTKPKDVQAQINMIRSVTTRSFPWYEGKLRLKYNNQSDAAVASIWNAHLEGSLKKDQMNIFGESVDATAMWDKVVQRSDLVRKLQRLTDTEAAALRASVKNKDTLEQLSETQIDVQGSVAAASVLGEILPMLLDLEKFKFHKGYDELVESLTNSVLRKTKTEKRAGEQLAAYVKENFDELSQSVIQGRLRKPRNNTPEAITYDAADEDVIAMIDNTDYIDDDLVQKRIEEQADAPMSVEEQAAARGVSVERMEAILENAPGEGQSDMFAPAAPAETVSPSAPVAPSPAAAVPPSGGPPTPPPPPPTGPRSGGPAGGELFPPSRGEMVAMDLDIYPTREAAQAAAAEQGSPVIDLGSGAADYPYRFADGSHTWVPGEGKVSYTSRHKFNDRRHLWEIHEAAYQAGRATREAAHNVEGGPDVELLRRALDPQHAGDMRTTSAAIRENIRSLDLLEARYLSTGTEVGANAARSVRQYRDALMDEFDFEDAELVHALGEEALRRSEIADSLLSARPKGGSQDDFNVVDRALTRNYDQHLSAGATIEEALKTTAEAKKLKDDLGRIRRGNAKPAARAAAIRRSHETMAASGGMLVEQARRLLDDFGAPTGMLEIPEQHEDNLLYMFNALNLAAIRLDDAIADTTAAHVSLIGPAGGPVEHFASMAEVGLQFSDQVQVWTRDLAAMDRAIQGSDLANKRYNYFDAIRPDNEFHLTWKKLHATDTQLDAQATTVYDRKIQADAETPRVREQIAQIAKKSKSKKQRLAAKEAGRVLDDYPVIDNLQENLLAKAAPEDHDRMRLNLAILQTELFDAARHVNAGIPDFEAATVAVPQQLAQLRREIDMVQTNVSKNPVLLEQLQREAGWKMRETGDLIAPEHVAKALNTVAQSRNIPEFMATLRRITADWKGLAVFSPGFHVRNIMGGAWNNMIDGVRRNHYEEFTKAYKATLKGEGGGDAELVRLFMEEGIIGIGVFRAEVPEIAERGTFRLHDAKRASSWNLIAGTTTGGRKQNPMVAANREVGGRVEDVLRGTIAMKHYKEAIANGATQQAALDDAFDAVSMWHFNYNDLSSFEHNIRLGIPFWTWMSRNAALQFKLLAYKPQWALTAHRLYENIGEGYEVNPYIPAYFARNRYAQMGARTFLTAEIPPIAMAREATPSLTTLGGVANPLVRISYEVLHGRDTYRGTDLHGTELYWRQFENILPIVTRARRLAQAGLDRKGWTALNQGLSFLGAPIRTLTDDDLLRAEAEIAAAKRAREGVDETARDERRASRLANIERNIAAANAGGGGAGELPPVPVLN